MTYKQLETLMQEVKQSKASNLLELQNELKQINNNVKFESTSKIDF